MLPASLTIDAATRRVSLDPREDAFVQDPYAAYAAIRAGLGPSPVFLWEQYGHPCVMDLEAVQALFRDRRFGREVLHVASRDELGWPEPEPHLEPFLSVDRHSMLEREPPVHTRLRTLVNRAFVSRQVERLRGRVEALAEGLIDGFVAEGRAELIEAYAAPIPVLLIAELLGVPGSMAPLLLDWSHRVVAMYQFGRTRAVEDAAVGASLDFVAYLRGLIAERRARPDEGLVSHLVALERTGEALSEDELVSTCILLLNAGHEATVHSLGNAVKALLDSSLDPGAALAPDAVEATVEEALRHDPPLHLFTRYALEDVEVGGFHLRRGQEVGLMLGAANHDPARFAEPGRLWPGRPRVPHVAFGGGIHFCIGAPLARLEMGVALPALFRRLKGLRLDGTPRYRDVYHFHGLERLDVAWDA